MKLVISFSIPVRSFYFIDQVLPTLNTWKNIFSESIYPTKKIFTSLFIYASSIIRHSKFSFQNQPFAVFCKIDALKNFPEFKWKQPCQSLFLIKLQAYISFYY